MKTLLAACARRMDARQVGITAVAGKDSRPHSVGIRIIPGAKGVRMTWVGCIL